MRYSEIINERYVNLTDFDQKREYAPRVLELIDLAYARIGGHIGLKSVDQLLSDTGMWKLVRKNGIIILAVVYKENQGRKLVAVGHDGSKEAKDALKQIIAEDIKMNRMWAEVSGSMATFCLNNGLPVVPNTNVGELLGKEIISKDGEYKYTRVIGGSPHEKIIVGYPNGENLGNTRDIAKLIDGLG